MTLTTRALLCILDGLHVGITVVDENSRIILMNRLFGEMVQRSPESLIGTSVLGCHPPGSRPAVEQMMSDLKNRVKDHAEAWINFKGRIIYEYLYPIWDRDGNLVGIADELHDGAEQAAYMKRLGEWKEIPVSGLKELEP